MRTMTVDHERWHEFLERLAGPEGCNCRFDSYGLLQWDCAGDGDTTLATSILKRMGTDIDIPATLQYLARRGGFCDCKIILQSVRSDNIVLYAADGQEICHPDNRRDYSPPSPDEGDVTGEVDLLGDRLTDEMPV